MLLGFLASLLAIGKVMDAVNQKLTKAGPFPEACLPYLTASGTILPIGLLLYGWTAQYHCFWLVPGIGLFLVGLCFLAPLAATQHYIFDCYGKSGFAASAVAAMNVARFLAGFGLPLFADLMFDRLDLGLGNSLLGPTSAVVGCFSVSLWKFGPRLRRMSSVVEI
jgi:hypothetical protein